MSELRNPFGLVNGELFHIKDIHKGVNVICPMCNENLILKDGAVNAKHLAHNNGKVCNGESEVHKLVKEYIYNNVKHFIMRDFKLNIVNGELVLDGLEKLKVTNKDIESRRVSREYIPDILIRLENKELVSIEICYKNKKNEARLEEVLRNTSLSQVVEIVVTENDLIDMDVEMLLNRHEIVYSKIGKSLEMFNLNMHRERIIADADKLKWKIELASKNGVIERLDSLNFKLSDNIKFLENENRKLSSENKKYTITDVDKLKWQIEMLKERLSLYVE